jgi:quercetin dioxygenase-like cupin family protein
MKKLALLIATLAFVHPVFAQNVTTLLEKPTPELAGKEMQVITVDYPPGWVDHMHRHDAEAVVYVLEGQVEMQLKGGPLQRLGPGQIFYEGPNDIHVVGRNASKTKPAKFVVFFIKNQGAPILTPVQ